jgi:hypothetical protein
MNRISKLVYRAVLTVVVMAGCSRPSTPLPDPTRVTYVDATDGPTGNTRLATGEVLNAVSPSPIGNDSKWTKRVGGNNGKVFTSNDGTPPGPEDAPGLVTTIEELEPEARYRVFAYFWTDQHDWQLLASLSEKPPFTEDQPVRFGKVKGLVIKGGARTKAADFADTTLLKEKNRQLLQADLGEAVADGNGQIQVWIDDLANAHHSQRTWYDGVGVSGGPPRGQATRRPPLSLVLLGIVIAACLIYIARSILKNRRAVEVHPDDDRGIGRVKMH